MKALLVAVLGLFLFPGLSCCFPERACSAEVTQGQESREEGESWESRVVRDARITVEKGVTSMMNGISTPELLRETVENFYRQWDSWAESRLFLLQDDRDIDVFGNLYSLHVLCRTLYLAARDWYEAEQSDLAESVLEKAAWLDRQSELLAEPVAEIISRQSYSEYLPRRVELMKEQFDYVDVFYRKRPFSVPQH